MSRLLISVVSVQHSWYAPGKTHTASRLYYWQASEASETLSGVTNGIGDIYMVRARHFSSAGSVVRNVGGVKFQPFLKRSNYL